MSTPELPTALSLNGVDNVGKTTQLRWLDRAVPGAHLVGPIDTWHAGWADVAAGDFARWWFETSSTSEHTRLVLDSHAARRRASRNLALEDRGVPMLRAVCAATAVVKDRITPEEALDVVERIAKDLTPPQRRHEIHVLLRRARDSESEAVAALARETRWPDDRYVEYQHTLTGILAAQVEQGDYDHVLEIGDAPILDVQRRLRQLLASAGLRVDPLPETVPDRLWVLGGMSESGKSTVGELLRDEHGVTRLKIGYLLQKAADRADIEDPYRAWDPSRQAEELTEELLRFTSACKAPTVSVESARSFASTAHLKKLWGKRCTVLYVDAHDHVRTARATDPPEELAARDAEKSAHGAHRISFLADHVLDNHGTLSGLKIRLSVLANTLHETLAVPPEAVPITQSGWSKTATDHLVDEQTALVLATGTTGTDRWKEGWSDLDLLVVRDTTDARWLRDTVGTLPTPDGVKTAVSAFTPADVAARRVPPRVLRSLQLAAHSVGVLHRRDNYRIPVPTAQSLDLASRGDLGLVLMTLRRLLAADPIDIRDVYKHIVLVAKILLCADGHQLDDSEETLRLFAELHPDAAAPIPHLSHLIRHPGDPATQSLVVEASDRLLSYLDNRATS